MTSQCYSCAWEKVTKDRDRSYDLERRKEEFSLRNQNSKWHKYIYNYAEFTILADSFTSYPV